MAKQPIRPFWNEYATFAFLYRRRTSKLSVIARAMTEAVASLAELPPASVNLSIQVDEVKKCGLNASDRAARTYDWRRSKDWQSSLREAVAVEEGGVGSLLIEGRRPGAEVPILDFLWSVKIDDPFQQVAQFRDGTAVMRIHTDLLRRAGSDVAKHAVRRLVESIVLHAACHQGLVEIESGDMTIAGNVYTGFAGDLLPFDAALNYHLWRQPQTDSLRVVRKVTWGLFLGAEMAARFQTGADRAAAFVAARDKPHIKPLGQYVLKTSDGGIFFAMCDDPLAWADPCKDIDARATPLRFNTPGENRLFAPAWLLRELESLDMLM